jgi:Secretion system effector C (SseC) like family
MDGILNKPGTLSQIAEMQNPQVEGEAKTGSVDTKTVNFILDETAPTNGRTKVEPSGGSLVPMLDIPKEMSGDMEDMAAALMELQLVAADNQTNQVKNNIKSAGETRQEKLERLRADIQKMNEAKAKAKSHKHKNKIFGWISFAVTCVAAVAVGIIMLPTGPLDAVILAGFAASLTMQASSLTGNWLGTGGTVALGIVSLVMTGWWSAYGTIAGWADAKYQDDQDKAIAKDEDQVQKDRDEAFSDDDESDVTVDDGVGIGSDNSSIQGSQDNTVKTAALMKELMGKMDEQARAMKKVLEEMQDGVDNVAQILSGQQDINKQLIKEIGV